MASAVLTSHQRDARGGAHAHRIEFTDSHSKIRKSLHVGRFVPAVQWMLDRGSLLIAKKGDRGIHDPHIIDQYDHDVGLVRPLLCCKA